MRPSTFDEFRADALARGIDDVLERQWVPGATVNEHTHPFSVDARVVQGEMWLTCAGETRHLQSGDVFTLQRDVAHSERYGPQGATLWVARRRAD